MQRHEPNTATIRLNKLIDNEILLTQATQHLEEWPKKSTDHDVLLSKCKDALKSNNGENVPPRTEILPWCAAVLINANESSDLVRIDRRFPSSDLFSAFAAIIIELEQHKANASKKVFRDAWDIIAPMFANGGHFTSMNSRRGRSTPQHSNDTGKLNEKNEKKIGREGDFFKRKFFLKNLLSVVDDGNDGSDRKDADDNPDNMPFDDHGGSMQDDSGRNGAGSRMDVDEVDRPFSNRNRGNFNSGNDTGGYGMRESPAVIVNTNLLPFIQNLRDSFRKFNVFN